MKTGEAMIQQSTIRKYIRNISQQYLNIMLITVTMCTNLIYVNNGLLYVLYAMDIVMQILVYTSSPEHHSLTH